MDVLGGEPASRGLPSQEPSGGSVGGPERIPEFTDRGLAGVGIMLQRAVDRVRHTDRQPGPHVGQPP
jgi:hypothetical protein